MTTRAQKTADFGALRTDFPNTVVKCKSPDSFATRLDLQTNTAAGWDASYVSGARLYCNDNSPPQPLNWNTPSNTTAFVNFNGKVADDGIKDMMFSHGEFINLIGYGTETMAGNIKRPKVWQQAAQKEYSECRLVGLECAHIAWMNGCRVYFSCPVGSKSLPGDGAAAAGGAGASDAQAAACANGEGGFGIGTFAGGIGAGLVVAAAVVGLLAFMRRRKGPGASQESAANKSEPQQVLTQPPPMQVVASDPYDTLFLPTNNSTLATSPSTLPPPMGQYTDVHPAANVGPQQQQYGQAGSEAKEDWQYLPKP